MKKVYIKNFKGFVEQIIELEDVNFLVGENSTGKTSLISLVNLLSSNEFWFDNQFNNEEIELGYFEEILSKNTTEKYFQIGTEKVDVKQGAKSSKTRNIRILFQFKSNKSLPVIEWLRFAVNDLNVLVIPKLKRLECSYYFKSFESFDVWINESSKQVEKKININLPFRLPIPVMIQFINNEIREKTKREIDFFEFNDGRFYQDYTWLAPIRAKAKRIYESYNVKFSPEGEHIPTLLKNLLNQKKNGQKTIEIIEKFGQDSNLFDSIRINELGNKNMSPFEIIIKYNDIESKLPHVGYGVSQILPLIIEVLSSKKNMYSIQQPEVHLHPKAQAAFGSFLYKACVNEEHKFIIETHSDFTINRFRHSMLNDTSKKSISSQILFFERNSNGNNVTSIKIDKKGMYSNEPPDSYRDFFIDEELRLLEL